MPQIPWRARKAVFPTADKAGGDISISQKSLTIIDRRDFINRGYIKTDNTDTNCGPDDCECDPVPAGKNFVAAGGSIHQLFKLAVLAFTCAGFVTGLELTGEKTSFGVMLRAKKENAISCKLTATDRTDRNDEPPANRDNSNCFHQQMMGCLCEAKRRYKRTVMD